MPELYVIIRTNGLYYHSLIPRGRPLWCDTKEDAQYLTYDEALSLMALLGDTLPFSSLNLVQV